jgi:hypothetical protein
VTAILEPAAPDAEAIRNRILQMFELAEAEEDLDDLDLAVIRGFSIPVRRRT